jgi:signal peptidase I
MNFEWFLVIATFITGLIALMEKLKYFYGVKSRPILWAKGHCTDFFPVFLIVLLLRSFLAEPFRIPSGSLEPTLNVGDFVLVNKFAYGFRLPIINTKMLPVNTPKHGDIAVFRWPPDPHLDFIKRVIGLPGDKVSYHDKQFTINGQLIPLTKLEDTIDESSGNRVECYEENLFGIKHKVYQRSDIPGHDFDWLVPKGHYLMIGDNRDDSADSRYWGFVPESLLRGKALLVWMSWDGNNKSIRWNNLGKWIR